jgi:hypothetical protein
MVVSQDDVGIDTNLLTTFPNLIVFSAGGYGHVPIPLIKSEISNYYENNINYENNNQNNNFSWDIGFYGNFRENMARSGILKFIKKYSIFLN